MKTNLTDEAVKVSIFSFLKECVEYCIYHELDVETASHRLALRGCYKVQGSKAC